LAITNDSLVDSAAIINRKIVESRISSRSVDKFLSSYYLNGSSHG
jgi:hypothetical protein